MWLLVIATSHAAPEAGWSTSQNPKASWKKNRIPKMNYDTRVCDSMSQILGHPETSKIHQFYPTVSPTVSHDLSKSSPIISTNIVIFGAHIETKPSLGRWPFEPLGLLLCALESRSIIVGGMDQIWWQVFHGLVLSSLTADKKSLQLG